MIFDLDGSRINDKLSLLEETARVCGFPDHFGKNWDALNDCLFQLKQEHGAITLRVLGFSPGDGIAQADLANADEDCGIINTFVGICQGQSIDVVFATQKSAHDLLARANLYDILEPIRVRPALYLGAKSLTRLVSYIHGIQHVGGEMVGQPAYFKLDGRLDTHAFDEFVGERLGVPGGTIGWWTKILNAEIAVFGAEGADARAFDVFFELLDEFRTR